MRIGSGYGCLIYEALFFPGRQQLIASEFHPFASSPHLLSMITYSKSSEERGLVSDKHLPLPQAILISLQVSQ